MKLSKIRLTISAVTALVLSSSIASAASPAYFRSSMEDGGQSTVTALVKNGTVYVKAEAWEGSGLQLTWDTKNERAEFDGFNKKVAIRIGSKTGMLDGKLTDLGAAPFMNAEQLYVPVRFLVKVLEGSEVSWDAVHQVASASKLHTYAEASVKYGDLTYSVDKKNGKLYVTGKDGKQRLLGNLGSTLYDMVSFDFKKTPAGLLYLTITDVYGEPHINNKSYTIVMKNDGVIRQSSVLYHNRYGNNLKMYGNHLLLTDGKTLRLIEDGSGKVTDSIDLVALGIEKDNYFIEGMDNDFILIRPNQKGILTFIDRKTGAKTLLYKALLNKEQQEYAEINDVPFNGDYLEFVKRDGNTLQFRNLAQITKDDTLYKFILPN
jgi:hypothetical protein